MQPGAKLQEMDAALQKLLLVKVRAGDGVYSVGAGPRRRLQICHCRHRFGCSCSCSSGSVVSPASSRSPCGLVALRSDGHMCAVRRS